MSRRNVFITGATGVLGGAVLSRFINDGDSKVYTLIRARDQVELRARHQQLLHDLDGQIDVSRVAQRCIPVRGDVTRRNLGMARERYRELTETVTHAVHAAASVKLNLPEQEAMRISVGGARGMLDFASRCIDHGQFAKMEYVSTVGVAGRTNGLVPEEPMARDRTYHNTYESSKAAAETLVLKAMREGFPCTIHRPSMVVGDSRTGWVPRFQVFYYLLEFLSGIPTRGILPALDTASIDIVPLDYISRAIYVSCGTPESIGRIHHLCGGAKESCSIGRLSGAIRSAYRARGIALPKIRSISVGAFRRALPIIGFFSPRRIKRSLKGLRHLMEYAETRPQFVTVRTTAFLSGRGVDQPRLDDCLDRVIGYYADRRTG